MKVLIIGSGAREHAIADACGRSESRPKLVIYGLSRNPGLASTASQYEVADSFEPSRVVAFAQKTGAEMAIVGPEAPLAIGVVDELLKAGIATVGPTQAAARIETSKSFTRELLQEEDLPVYPTFAVVTDERGLDKWLSQYDGEFVVKPDGLTGGKGVKVQGDHFSTKEEGRTYALKCLHKDGRVVVEEKLIGQEFSLMSFSDGTHASHMPVVQDNKRLRSGDQGPNTGGMGSVSDANHSLPFLSPRDIEQAQKTNEQVIQALKARGLEYKGILYGNFMAVSDGIRLVEYNARFGDPEVMNVLSILESDFIEICQAVVDGTLDMVTPRFASEAVVCKYLIPEGYPENPVKNKKIDLNKVDTRQVSIYYGAVEEGNRGLYLTGSRAVALVGKGRTIAEAEKLVEEEIAKVTGPVTHRADIGTAALTEKRTAAMQELRQTVGVAVFASTRGTDLQAVLDAIRAGKLPGLNLQFVLSNKADAYALERARAAGVKTIFLNPKGKSREEYDHECLAICKEHNIDTILLIGYMRIISPAFIEAYRNKILNIHPSLLPKYPGMDLDVHSAVLAAGEKETGCTLHIVDESLDGGAIIAQAKVLISPDDTPESLKAKVQKKEQKIILETLRELTHHSPADLAREWQKAYAAHS